MESPTKCDCGTIVVEDIDGILRCPNQKCPDRNPAVGFMLKWPFIDSTGNTHINQNTNDT